MGIANSFLTCATVTLGWLHAVVNGGPVAGHDFGVKAVFDGRFSFSLHPRAAAGVVNQNLCQIWMDTYPWTTCQWMLDAYSLTAADFSSMNPSVDVNCNGFVPGHQYCLAMPQARYISQDGACGVGGNITCIGSKFGDCCGKSGRCGNTADYCAVGNCQDGSCPGLGYTWNGRCGVGFSDLLCGGSWGSCCSFAGRCGSTYAECAVGNCQSGACEGSTATSSTASSVQSSTASSTPTPPPYRPSPDGTCGGSNKYVCTNTTYFYGNCCGPRGFCGYSDWECMDILGCQNEYGLCDTVIVTTVSSLSSTASPTGTGTGTTQSTKSTTTTSQAHSSTSAAPPGPTAVQQYGAYALLGCLAEPTSGTGRALAFSTSDSTMTVEECLSGPALGYAFVGLEYGSQCFWADYELGGLLEANNDNCRMTCAGNPNQYCGGPSHLLLYSRNGAQLPPYQPPSFVQSVGDYKLVGCYDESGARALPNSASSDSMTVEACIAQAHADGATYAGIEYASQCFWGNKLTSGSLDPDGSKCNFLCAGNGTEYCGSGGHMTLYSLTGKL